MAKRHVMTARRKAALKKAQLASARKRRRNGRIDRKISRVKSRTKRKTARHHAQFRRNSFMDSNGAIFTNVHGIRAYQKNVKTTSKSKRKVSKLRSKKRK